MKWKILHIIITINLLVAGCTDSADDRSDNEQPQHEHELRLTMGMPQLQNTTRAAGDLPTGFTAYTYISILCTIIHFKSSTRHEIV